MDTSADDWVEVKADGSMTSLSEEDDATPQPRKVSPSMIDPALSGETVASPSSGESDENDIKANEVWVGIVRTIEDLREWIRYRLEHGEYEGSNERREADGPSKKGTGQVDGDGADASVATGVNYPMLSDTHDES